MSQHAAAHAAIEAVARDSYGRLLAILAVRTRDLVAAEDALSSALVSALETWPREGVPLRPLAWLLTASRNRWIDQRRGDARRQRLYEEFSKLVPTAVTDDLDEATDERLRLMLACAHESLDPSLHPALILQTVLGLEAKEIARAYLTSPSTMAQRLVRAKAKLREVGAPFDLPGPERLEARLPAVLAAIYTAYSASWDAGPDAEHRLTALADEAVSLARLVVRLLPEEPEARGLLALLLFSHARRRARAVDPGGFVPLGQQDPRLWEVGEIEEADRHLLAAGQKRRLGKYQLEAAIQSAHADRRRTGSTPWSEVARLYDALIAINPSLGARVGRAAALGEGISPAAGLAELDAIPEELRRNYQPYWATLGHLLAASGDRVAASDALTRAIGLTEDPRVRTYLMSKRDSEV